MNHINTKKMKDFKLVCHRIKDIGDSYGFDASFSLSFKDKIIFFNYKLEQYNFLPFVDVYTLEEIKAMYTLPIFVRQWSCKQDFLIKQDSL